MHTLILIVRQSIFIYLRSILSISVLFALCSLYSSFDNHPTIFYVSPRTVWHRCWSKRLNLPNQACQILLQSTAWLRNRSTKDSVHTEQSDDELTLGAIDHDKLKPQWHQVDLWGEDSIRSKTRNRRRSSRNVPRSNGKIYPCGFSVEEDAMIR